MLGSGQMAPLAVMMMLTLITAPVLVLFSGAGVTVPYGRFAAVAAVWCGVAPGGLYVVFLPHGPQAKVVRRAVVLVAAGFVIALAQRLMIGVDWTLLLVFMAMFIGQPCCRNCRRRCRAFSTGWRACQLRTLA
ncbi:hypothetical protein KCP77_18090 [Salmonella enterica subsp. enterica]|nr:hypothetical protein KCP77_18090 [Salmonella enterica subsp. enterica]